MSSIERHSAGTQSSPSPGATREKETATEKRWQAKDEAFTLKHAQTCLLRFVKTLNERRRVEGKNEGAVAVKRPSGQPNWVDTAASRSLRKRRKRKRQHTYTTRRPNTLKFFSSFSAHTLTLSPDRPPLVFAFFLCECHCNCSYSLRSPHLIASLVSPISLPGRPSIQHQRVFGACVLLIFLVLHFDFFVSQSFPLFSLSFITFIPTSSLSLSIDWKNSHFNSLNFSKKCKSFQLFSLFFCLIKTLFLLSFLQFFS